MKKISLKAVKNGLSRDEMRSVKGGCIGGINTENCIGGVKQCSTSCAERTLSGWICSSCCVA